ncbi:MAG: MotA/TolQ/ExbB proton channel family protein [Bacteriovoracaceae bacterium]|nr:MotA/TolQ/ExbB proton channel family protein [Bacteriovoracaceae bacterium]
MNWIVFVEWSARLILLCLVGLSVWSISIILDRRKFFKDWDLLETVDSLSKRMEDGEKFNLSHNEAISDPRLTYLIKVEGASADKLDHYFTAFINEGQKSWKKGLSVLGSLGSTTPFIGLLGTILGIIVSFGELSKGSVDMKGVMFSLAEALILTAVGLAVAIPAVIAFNIFNKKVVTMIKDIESIKELKKTI